MKIKNIIAREILDSRGNPTIEADVILENGIIGRASVPSGASTGSKEAIELRDNEKRYLGKGVQKAISNINGPIRKSLIGKDSSNQQEIDEIMIKLDGTPNKSNMGANAILAVSIANLKASAKAQKTSLFKYIETGTKLPTPMINIINGGAHANNKLDFQEFMIIPKFATMKERIQAASEIFHTLKEILKSKHLNTSVGDEGGFAPDLKSNEEALKLIIKAIKKADYLPGENIFLALDIAASELVKGKKYILEAEDKKLTSKELIKYYKKLVKKYPIISLEDPLAEDDWEGFKLLTDQLGDKIQIVGDDLFVTNKKYLKQGIDKNIANAILIKPNQIGTVTETLETINLAKSANYKTIISHRSGETEDTFIADLAVATNAGQIKTGSMSRGERICKYNRLLRIEEELLLDKD